MTNTEWMDFFAGKRSGVLQRFANISTFQIGILGKNFVSCHAIRDKVHNKRDSDTHASNASPAAHNSWVKSDSFKHVEFES